MKPGHDELVPMVDVFCACIETETLPAHGSRCHRIARDLVDGSGCKPKRRRRKLKKIKETT